LDNKTFCLLGYAFKLMVRRMMNFLSWLQRKTISNSLKPRLSSTKNKLAFLCLDNMDNLVVSLDSEWLVSLINRKGCELLGREESMIVGLHWFADILLLPKNETGEPEKTIPGLSLEGSFPVYQEGKIKKGDGSYIHIGFTYKKIVDPTSRLPVILCTGEDITARKGDEQKLTEALEKKDVLLRELHHRTKNNMQVISAIINLNGMKTDDPLTHAILDDLDGKIQSMALVHRKLYESGDFSNIDMAGYLQDLVASINLMYPERSSVNFELDLEPVMVQVDVAIPFGIVVNELVCNALKHAFPADAEGTIWILLRKDGEDGLRLLVEDDGNGLPEPLEVKDASVGLQVVRGIVERQLGGTLVLANKGGASCSVRVKTDLYKRQSAAPSGTAD